MDKSTINSPAIDANVAQALLDGTLDDPFSVLGPHLSPAGKKHTQQQIRVFVPGAEAVEVLAATSDVVLSQLHPLQIPGLFAGLVDTGLINTALESSHYRLRIHWPNAIQVTEDPYAFGLLLGELDLHLLAEGNHFELASCLGAQLMTIDGVSGVRFAVWAPNARRVSVVGGFNSWDGRRHPMRKRVEVGVWELFVPRLQAGELYQFEILGQQGLLPLKTDPVAQQVEMPPRTAAIVACKKEFIWSDADWMRTRASTQTAQQPLSIYEVHAASWRRILHDQNRSLNWDELAAQLIPYVCDLGFTHIELLPIMAHPFGGSWGYQPLGLFAPQATFGDPAAFARFIDRCHASNIGVILDWVPAHFPSDSHGLGRFDGTALYEHEDPREGFHQDWKTLIYNLGRREVHSFLLASALHWLEYFHIDGLRVDAVASMLYRDYSRAPGKWIPNRYGGRENLEAVEFLRHLNEVVAQRCNGALVIAEESTAWPGVTQSTEEGGLGFSFKWNMGWMHDTLAYMSLDPVYRAFNNDKMTFGLVYAFSEKFVLALSHDEVVHGKGSLLRKMSGDHWQQFASLRAYYAFVWTHPGKKLLFMGCEFAQEQEWNHDLELSWFALDNPFNRGVHRLIRDLNNLYRTQPALYQSDSDGRGFQWVVCDDAEQSVLAFCRYATEQMPTDQPAPHILVVCNFTPVPRYGYRIGVPNAGLWREVLNSDSEIYGGSNIGNIGGILAAAIPSHGLPFSVEVTAPPLGTTMFVADGDIWAINPDL